MSRTPRILLWILGSLAAIVILIASFVTWIVATESGTRWAVARAHAALGDKLEVGSTRGSIAGPLVLTNVHYRDPAVGIDVLVAHVSVDVVMRDLLRRIVHVRDVTIDGLSVAMSEPTQPKPPPEESKPFSLQPPIDMSLDSLRLDRARIERDDVPLLEITRAELAARWTDIELAIEKLALDSPQGRIRFAGRLDPANKGVGNGNGTFRWRFGERTVAGNLKALGEKERATLVATLTAPVNANLDVSLRQEDQLPWEFKLDVPRFDPRDELLPDTKVSALALTLSGEGTLQRGTLKGEVTVDDGVLHLDPLSFARDEKNVRVDGVIRPGDKGGEIKLGGDVRTADQPLSAKAEVLWHDVVVPAFWAGQDLYTRGELRFDGNAENYAATGKLSLGPKDRIADIELNVRGSPETVALRQFDIVQERGRLAMTGELGLKPRISWNVKAQATQFDPGAFAAAWAGRLNFGLASEGLLAEAGPRGTFVLKDLNGRLRGRDLSGQADLLLTHQPVVAGTLSLHSGKSDVEFRGKRGEAMDATLNLNVSTLNDWLPNSSGQLRADFAIKGIWPNLAIDGNTRGSGIDVATLRADNLDVAVDIERPTNPSGSASVDVRGLSVSGFNFSSVVAKGSGTPDAHELTFDAKGDPLSAQFAVQGARKGAGWSGSLNQLVLNAKDAARLALREPVKIDYGAGEFGMSRACLADQTTELCARAEMKQTGVLSAEYSIKALPLSLANVLVPADLPVTITGVIEGQGNVRKTAQGEWQGNAEIRSPSGRIDQKLEGEEGATETLFSYDQFRVAANLNGRDARASVGANLMEGGSLQGEVALNGLGEPSTPVNGRVALRLPTLVPVAAFAPQLANVRGRVDAKADLRGTLQQPDIEGELLVADLATDVPAIGLRLKNGRVEAKPAPDGSFALKGGIQSGDGTLNFDGRATVAGEVDLKIKGDRFLAADMAGAQVIVAPNLQFMRAEQRMSLKGEVRVPKAKIDMQKLPRGQRAPKPSSDVVVVDEHTVEEEIAQIPLYADVTIVIGDEVELTGFGLQAKVDGQLKVIESPGEPTLGSGTIRVDGKYKAYGQDLTIQQGQLLYASTPLDNPGLSITAVREVEDVTAGLRIAGTAKAPELTIFSDPAMSQANALSYLVAGKPLDDLGSSEGEGDAVQSAARSLGTAAGGLLAKNIGRRLGVDEVGVKDDEMIGGSALTVGQYLSPRVYLSYGVGLFEPGEVVTLRYKWKKDFSVQAQAGPEDTRAGVQYKIER
jgi:translocation and assembly module TamB